MAGYVGPNGEKFAADGKTTPFALFKEWNIKGAIAATLDGHPVDLHAVLADGGAVRPILPNSPEGLEIIRHSASHLMAQAILRLYPGARFGVGPAIKDGFYYDVLFPTPISDEDLPAIEAEMKRIVKEKLRIERLEMSSPEALERSEEHTSELQSR